LKFWRIWLSWLFCRQKFWHNLNKTGATRVSVGVECNNIA